MSNILVGGEFVIFSYDKNHQQCTIDKPKLNEKGTLIRMDAFNDRFIFSIFYINGTYIIMNQLWI